MIASVTSIQINVDEIDKAVDVYDKCVIPERKMLKGTRGGYLLINHTSGKGLAITLWDTVDAYQAYLINERTGNYQEQLHKFKSHFTSSPISLGQYEVCTID